jgi:hypothetical protein
MRDASPDMKTANGSAALPSKIDRHHDAQLLRDTAIINASTVSAYGPLPRGGLPEQVKRKPNLPKPKPPALLALAVDDIPTDPAGAEMFILGKLFKKRIPREPWPLRFDSFSFDARCYHTLKCMVIFSKSHHISEKYQIGPSGEPYAPDWKDHWHAGYNISAEDVFPSPVEVYWTAMDGIARKAVIDLEKIFPERLILHNALEEEVMDGWGLEDHARRVQILVEVNDRTINIYMRAWVALKQRRNPEDRMSDDLRDLMLAWTKTY